MMKSCLLMIALTLIGCQSQLANNEKEADNPSLQEYCRQNPCRAKTTIALRSKTGDYKQSMSFFWPAIQENAISILPGEQLYIEADIVDDELINLSQVLENENPNKTFVLEFSQIAGSYAMMLSVKNPFDVRIKFNMEVMDFRGGLHKTSSCPLGAQSSLFESWPQPFVQLFMINPSILSEDDNMGCVY